MQFKSGMGWKAGYDEKTGNCAAETGGPGAYDLYEISKETFDLLDPENNRVSCDLIYKGRHLYMDVNDRCGPPYTVVLDSDYLEIAPWAKVVSSGHVWSDELTDAAVELFASERQNREQRKKKRAEREAKKSKG